VIIGIPLETTPGEKRIPVIPDSIRKLKSQYEKLEIRIQVGLGEAIRFSDQDYIDAGGTVASREEILKDSDLLLFLNPPGDDDIKLMKEGALYLGFLDPFNQREKIKVFQEKRISAFSMELIPRTTKAQKMDALSSQASLAGYAAVLTAAGMLDRILPMMMTPAGTLSPAKVFIIGAGVAGLQAIATAKRLGARVDAYDTRPVVEEQVKSLGAKFVKVDLGETGQTKDGYAKELTEEQLEKQRKVMAQKCAQADIVITTAKLFGRKAPLIVKKDMVEGMSPGSIIVDLAAETGGNVEVTKAGEIINHKGVTVVGTGPLEGQVAAHASQMYSSNLFAFVSEFYQEEKDALIPTGEDAILKGALVTHQGEVVNELVNKVYGGQ